MGRILRKEHEGLVPRIYDIVDNFSVFSNQAQRRRKFYEGKKYTILTSQVARPEISPIKQQVVTAMALQKLEKKKRVSNKKGELAPGVCLISDD